MTDLPSRAGIAAMLFADEAKAVRKLAGEARLSPEFMALHLAMVDLRFGYLRKNGVPYSGNAVMTEYFERGR